MLVGFVLHHTGTVENPPVWGEEVQARLFRREFLRRGVDCIIINKNQGFPREPDLTFYFASDIPLRGGKVKFLWVQNDWDFKTLGEGNINRFDNQYDLVLHSSPVLQKLHQHGPLFRMPGDPEMYHPMEPSGKFPLVDVVYVSNNIKPYLNDEWIKPLAKRLGPERFRIYGSVWGGSGLEKWWGGAPPGLVVPDIFASAKIVLSLHLDYHRKYNVPTCRIPEALLAGKPVVSDNVGFDEFTRGVWFCTTGKQVVDAVDHILIGNTETNAVESQVADGREYILNHHTFGHRTDELLKFYEMVKK